MRTTANYIHMHILFLNMQVLDVELKLNIAVFYNGTARCYRDQTGGHHQQTWGNCGSTENLVVTVKWQLICHEIRQLSNSFREIMFVQSMNHCE